jgi:hypothetical protein
VFSFSLTWINGIRFLNSFILEEWLRTCSLVRVNVFTIRNLPGGWVGAQSGHLIMALLMSKGFDRNAY